jgi:FKBP-type peptidyl-prolyl cis-trans isomerase
MRTSLATALVAGLLVTGSAMAASAAQAPKAASAPKPAAHATAAKEKTAMGTVKSVDANTLVLKTKKGDMSFGIGSAAHKDTLATGANVTVHYTTEGKTMTATDVMVSPAKTTKK